MEFTGLQNSARTIANGRKSQLHCHQAADRKATIRAKGRLLRFNKKSVIGCPALSPKELKRALANLNGRHALRNRALLLLGVRSGLRISELLALRVGQVWDGDNVVSRFYISRRDTKGKQSGSSIVMHPEAAQALTRWISGSLLS